MRKHNAKESAPAEKTRLSAPKGRIGLQSLCPALLLAAILTLFASFTGMPHRNPTETAACMSAQDDDSTQSVIAWFSKNDTMTYWINESNWKFEGTDTIKTLGVNTKIMITVTDSTKNGYKMEYRFLKFSMDTDAESEMQDFMRKAILRLQDEIAGTTIRFRTDEVGKIIRYDNLKEVEKLARHVFDEIINEMPAVDNLASTGIKTDALYKNMDARTLVQSYTEELEMLFQYHGYRLPLKETNMHEAATDTRYESDTYMSTTVDPESYEYEITVDINNYIPGKDVKELLGKVIETLTDKKEAASIKKEMNTGFDEQVTEDAVRNEFLYLKYFPDGWPEEAVSQKNIFFGNKGRLTQKYITWDYRSVGNPN